MLIALREYCFICLIRNESAIVNMIYRNESFTASPGEQFSINLDSAFTIARRFPCNV